MPKTKNNILGNNGYITLLSVLVIGAVSLSVVISLLLLGLGSSRTSFALEQSSQVKALANACGEAGLMQIRDDDTFTGNGNLSIGQGSCTYNVQDNGGENRTIQATGTVDNIIRKVKIIINTISPQISVTSWREVADF